MIKTMLYVLWAKSVATIETGGVLHLRAPGWCTKVLFNLKSLFLNKKKSCLLRCIFSSSYMVTELFFPFVVLSIFFSYKIFMGLFSHKSIDFWMFCSFFLYVYISFRIGKMIEILRLLCKIFEFCQSENSFFPIWD